MAEFSTNVNQTIPPGESLSFQVTVVPCEKGLIRRREGSGNILLKGWVPQRFCRCGCNISSGSANYEVMFSGNIQVPTGGTPGTISAAIALDGTTLPDSVMSVTPAAVEEPFNIAKSLTVQVWRGCCQTVTVRNISDQPITFIAGADIQIDRPDLK